MVDPKSRRAVVGVWAQETCCVSERRAWREVWVYRALVRYRTVKPDDAPLRGRLRELAGTRPNYGVRRLHVLPRREGLAIYFKKVHRLYPEEGLQLKPRRRRSATTRQPRAVVTQRNHRLAMDFMHDVLSGGRTIRVFMLIEVCTRECVALHAAKSFISDAVARLLCDAGERRGGLPR